MLPDFQPQFVTTNLRHSRCVSHQFKQEHVFDKTFLMGACEMIFSRYEFKKSQNFIHAVAGFLCLLFLRCIISYYVRISNDANQLFDWRWNKLSNEVILIFSFRPDLPGWNFSITKHSRRAKKAHLVWFKKLQGVRQIPWLKQQRFYPSLSIKHKNLTRKSCEFIFYFIGSVVKIVLLLFLRKGRQTSKELKRNMNDELSFSWCLYSSIFLLKKRLWRRCFPANFANFLRILF